jgi:hypothetical protein
MSRACSNVARWPAEKAGTIGTRVIVRAGVVAGLLLCAWALGVGTSSANGPLAVATRSMSLNETGRLHLTSKHGFTLNEEGSATGTIRGKIYLHLRIVSTNRVRAEVSIYPSGGSLTGYAAAAYHVVGATASFSGSMSIARGTGRYRRAHASGLGFKGTIRRSNDAVTVSLTGNMSA